jgi:NAD(P)-dependent dehydrogenase (short-subunit alcohol dehydrogenase family)
MSPTCPLFPSLAATAEEWRSMQSFELPQQQNREVRQVSWNFRGETVLITGAAHGQGRQHALRFAKAGADLALCDLDSKIEGIDYPLGTPAELDAVGEECRAFGATVVTRVCDVRDATQVASFVEDAAGELGKIDIAVANAGLSNIVDVVDMTENDWDIIVDTNLKGVFLTLKHVAKHMIRAGGGGRMIATGSVHSFTGIPGGAHYSAAKHGLAGFCKALAIELAPYKIRVNYVCPTALNTVIVEMMNSPRVPADHGERIFNATGSWNLLDEGAPLVDPAEVSEAVMWLASDSSKYVTGAPLIVDAGFLAK